MLVNCQKYFCSIKERLISYCFSLFLMKNKNFLRYTLMVIVALVVLWIIYHLFTGHYFDRDVRFCKSFQNTLGPDCIGGVAAERSNPELCTDIYNKYFVTFLPLFL